MNRQRTIVVLAFVAFVLGLVWLLFRSPSASPTPPQGPPVSSQTATPKDMTSTSPNLPSEDQDRNEVLEQIESAFKAPIAFYGRVIDNHGDPVSHATIGYTATDKFLASGSNYQGQADDSGFFEISGIQGASLSVGVRKGGYYFVDETDRSSPSSSATFAYGMGADSYRRPAPTKENPAIFVLHKMGETEELLHVRASARIQKDGTPVTIELTTGRASPNGHLRIEAWTETPQQGRKFSWRCRISVSGGGLVERQGNFDFVAPENGYEQSKEIGMSHDVEGWDSQQEHEYFVRLQDGRYSRINFRMIAGGNHYFVMESYLNPEPGNRNLEFDPEKVVQSP